MKPQFLIFVFSTRFPQNLQLFETLFLPMIMQAGQTQKKSFAKNM